MIVIPGTVDGVRIGRHGTRNAAGAAGHHAHIVARRRRCRRNSGGVVYVTEFADISIMTGATPGAFRGAEPALTSAVIVRTSQRHVRVGMVVVLLLMGVVEVERVFAVMTLGIGQMYRGTAIALREGKRGGQAEERRG